jgi:hypothetical protein
MLKFKDLMERLNVAKAKMGDVIKDFQDSDAPQFKGKSDEKRRQMAIAAKLEADRGVKEEVEELDEISKELGQNYMNKAAKSMSNSSYGSKTYNKRNKGISTALEKIRPGTRNPSKFSTMEPVKKPVKVAATEEVEQTDEALKGNQHKIDANKNGKVDGHDFKILRNAKKARYQ